MAATIQTRIAAEIHAPTIAPAKLSSRAPPHTGMDTFHSIEPLRMNSQVPSSPVKRKVNKAVAAASWTLRLAKVIRAGMSRTPPTPTAPTKIPTTTQHISRSSRLI